MNAYVHNFWIRAGVILLVLGCGPLLGIGLLAAIGLWPDPNPNPVGPGLLFLVTAWPTIICLAVGIAQVRRARARSAVSGEPMDEARGPGEIFRSPLFRLLIGLVGVALAAYGLKYFLDPAEDRGPGSALILAVVAFYWAIRGEIPSWFRRRF